MLSVGSWIRGWTPLRPSGRGEVVDRQQPQLYNTPSESLSFHTGTILNLHRHFQSPVARSMPGLKSSTPNTENISIHGDEVLSQVCVKTSPQKVRQAQQIHPLPSMGHHPH